MVLSMKGEIWVTTKLCRKTVYNFLKINSRVSHVECNSCKRKRA